MFAIQKILNQFSQKLVLKSRFLTVAEKDLAISVFADTLNLDHIQIIAHRLILPHYAMSPNGHVYFNQQDWCEDFGQCSLAKQSWLIHELTHVWQIQQGIAVVRKAIFDRRYQYVLEQGKQFLAYGIEQQAQMVQDYFLTKATGQDCQPFERCIPFLKNQSLA